MLVTVMWPSMRSTMRLEIASPRPVPPNLRVEEPSACSKSRKIRARSSVFEADAGVTHFKPNFIRGVAWLDDNRDPAFVSELDGVAHEVEQNLPQACGIADHLWRQVFIHERCNLDALRLRAWGHQFNRLFDHGRQRERPSLQIEFSRFDFREIKDLLDQREQCLARRFRGPGICELIRQ